MKNIQQEGLEPASNLTNASVQPDKHKCLTAQGLASDPTDASPCQPLQRCSCCHRLLPLCAFYLKGHLQKPDRCCKECRKADNRLRRKAAKCSVKGESPRRRYPVITEIEQESVRMYLLRKALQTVRESVLRKRRRRYEEDF